MHFQQVPPDEQFAISLERMLRRKETKEHGGKKANSWLSCVTPSLDKMGTREQGQDTLKRAETRPAQWGRGLSHLPVRAA